MILNELSIRGNCADREDVNCVISQFLRVCQKIFHEREDRDFYYTAELLTKELISGYTIHDWFQDSKVPQQEKAFLRTIINRRQLIKGTDFPGSELMVKVSGDEKISAVGCLEEHLYSLVEKEKSRVRLVVSSGRELWEKREILYPHLRFCDDVQGQLEEARLALHIQMIMKRLQVLEDYFQKFDGRFDKNEVGYGCRGESETVEKNDELRRLRVFRTPYGKEEFFGWHISFAGNFPGRIHFIPDVEHRLGIVGYIGKHLPTGRFSTI